jgi:hypothetical protein
LSFLERTPDSFSTFSISAWRSSSGSAQMRQVFWGMTNNPHKTLGE